MTAIQAPVDLSAATRVGSRIYRKQVLSKGTINYPLRDGTRRSVTFDDKYLTDLANAYTAGAYDHVPFQLAGPDNAHTEDVRQYGGRVIGAEVTDDGLDVILELSQEAADLVEKTGRRLGVSARIKEALEHVDGRRFPHAIRHVLGTLDPRMQHLKPWEPIDLAADDDPVLDLSAAHYQQEGIMPRLIDLSALDPDQAEALASFAAANAIDLADAEVDPGDDDEPDGPWIDGDSFTDDGDLEDETGDDAEGDGPDDGEGTSADGDDQAEDTPADGAEGGISDDDLEALIDAELADVALSSDPDDEVLDLAAGLDAGDEVQADRRENANLRFKLAAKEYAQKGVPPYLIDLAEPILSLSDTEADSLDLASPATGDPIDVRAIVRDMLDGMAGTLDLSSETGYGHETEPDERVQALASRWTEYLETN